MLALKIFSAHFTQTRKDLPSCGSTSTPRCVFKRAAGGMLATPALCGILKKIPVETYLFFFPQSPTAILNIVYKWFRCELHRFFRSQRSVVHVIPCIEIHFATSCTVLYFHANLRNLTRTYISSNLTCLSPGSIFLIDSISQGDKVSTQPSNTTQ